MLVPTLLPQDCKGTWGLYVALEKASLTNILTRNFEFSVILPVEINSPCNYKYLFLES